VPYIAGANSYDGYKTLAGAGFTPGAFLAEYQENQALRAAYAEDFAVSGEQAATRLFGDMRYVYAAWATAGAMATVNRPGYLFYFAAPTQGLPGAAHGAHYREVFGAGPSALRSYLLNFVKVGNPNGDGLPYWAPFDERQRMWMVLDPAPKPTRDKLETRMQLLKDVAFPGAD
jgi:para-nitrobenzyl esterase